MHVINGGRQEGHPAIKNLFYQYCEALTMNCLKMTEAIEMSFGMQNWWDHEAMWGLDAPRERDIVC